VTLTVYAQPSHLSNMRVVRVDFDNSYQTGGMPLSNSDLGFGQGWAETVIALDRKGYLFDYDMVNQKLLAYVPGAAGAPDNEVANATDLSAVTRVVVLAFGIPQ
jgi:hypothetical protein